MGNAKEALRIITNILDDIYQAIEFCKEYDDKDLWEDLIKFALDKPSKTFYLLLRMSHRIRDKTRICFDLFDFLRLHYRLIV